MDKELQYYLQETFQLPVTVNEMKEAENFLVEKINDLIKNNFDLLVYILYRVDVNETKLKQVLKNNPNEDAGKIIAGLLIERQLQKIILRKQFTKKMTDLMRRKNGKPWKHIPSLHKLRHHQLLI